MNNWRSIALVLALVTALPGLADDSGVPVMVAPIELKPIERRVSTYGTLSPKIEELSFKISGRIAAFHVEEGAEVTRGDLLAGLETRDARDALQRRRVELEQAERSYQRIKTLHDKGSVHRSQLEDAQAGYDQARIAFEQAELNLQRCELRAPSDGLILKEHLESRTTVSAGQPIFSFQSHTEEWVTKVDLTDRNAFALGEGARASIRFAPYAGIEFSGVLNRLARVANPGDALYTAEVTIAPAGYELRPGMVAEVDLYQSTDEAYPHLPFDALVDLRRDSGHVYVVTGDGTAREQRVTLLSVQGNRVAIREPLSGFDEVIVRGHQALRDGERVRVLGRD